MAGRPTKYSPQMILRVAALYGSGRTDKQVAEALGVTEQTINNWKKKHPEFFESRIAGTEVADRAVENALLTRALGYVEPVEHVFSYFGKVSRVKSQKHHAPDTTAIIHWLKNRKPKEWGGPGSESTDDYSRQTAKVCSVQKTFEQFAKDAGYPPPFPKQLEMRDFAIVETVARLLLGSRGYGKTDYVVILGLAYELYLYFMGVDLGYVPTSLIITKSREKNTAILGEIEHACTANGVVFEKANAQCLRLEGHRGKDHSISAVTIKTKSLRGRHPYRVVMDDPVTEDDTSEATRKHVEKIYNECFKLTPNILVIGQPAHKHDLYAEKRKLIKIMEIPHGTIPELDHDLEAQRLAGVDEKSIQASYFLKILEDGTAPFGKIRYIDKFPKGSAAVAWIDPSFTGGDYTALTILKAYMGGVAVYGKVYKKAWNHCIEEMIPHLKACNVKKLGFETNSLGDQPLIILRGLFKEKKLSIGVQGKTSVKNKHQKIMSAGQFAEFIHLSKESDKTYTDHVVQYEYKAKFDDAPDSLASCLDWVGLIR